MIRVFIADDHAIVRDGLKKIISDDPGMVVVGEAANGRDAIRQLLAQEVEVALLDISMPEADGLEVLKRIHHHKPHLPILILSMHSEEMLAWRFLKCGAAGYLTKDAAPDRLRLAIRKVAAGGRYLGPALLENVAELVGGGGTNIPLHEQLTNREFSVLCKLAAGMSTSQVAEAMALSPSTVSTYRNRLLEKLRLSSNAELVQYALTHGLME